MSKRIFPDIQQQILSENTNVLTVSDKSITIIQALKLQPLELIILVFYLCNFLENQDLIFQLSEKEPL